MSDINKQVDAFILASLPATFGELVALAGKDGHDWYRKIDMRLQALRRKHLITFERNGNRTVWSPTPNEVRS